MKKSALILMSISLMLLVCCSGSIKRSDQFSDNLEEWIIPDKVKVKEITYKGKDAKYINNKKKEEGGIIYLKNKDFSNGIIECDIASDRFSGIAFRVQDEKQAECIYFRPFNSGTEKHENTVQYVARGTDYTWSYLRENFPGKYESGAEIYVDEWFHVKLEIKEKEVKVYVNEGKEPVLVVNDMKLDKNTGSVGLWTWKGYFANLTIED